MRFRQSTPDAQAPGYDTPVRFTNGDNGVIAYSPDHASWTATISAPNTTRRFALGQNNKDTYISIQALMTRLDSDGFKPTDRSRTALSKTAASFGRETTNQLFHYTLTGNGTDNPTLHLLTPNNTRAYFSDEPVPGSDGTGPGSWRLKASTVMMSGTLGPGDQATQSAEALSTQILSGINQNISINTTDLTAWGTQRTPPVIAIKSPALERIQSLDLVRNQPGREGPTPAVPLHRAL